MHLTKILSAAAAATIAWGALAVAAEPQMVVQVTKGRDMHRSIAMAAEQVCRQAVRQDWAGEYDSVDLCKAQAIASARLIQRVADNTDHR